MRSILLLFFTFALCLLCLPAAAASSSTCGWGVKWHVFVGRLYTLPLFEMMILELCGGARGK